MTKHSSWYLAVVMVSVGSHSWTRSLLFDAYNPINFQRIFWLILELLFSPVCLRKTSYVTGWRQSTHNILHVFHCLHCNRTDFEWSLERDFARTYLAMALHWDRYHSIRRRDREHHWDTVICGHWRRSGYMRLWINFIPFVMLSVGLFGAWSRYFQPGVRCRVRVQTEACRDGSTSSMKARQVALHTWR